MGFRDLIFERTEEPEAAAPASPAQAKPFTGNFTPPLTSANAEMIATIKKATLARKTPYTALLEAAEKLVGVIPDQTTRLKAAYAMIGSESRSIDQISKAIDLHVSDVDGEKMRFLQATKNQRTSDIGSLQSSVDSLRKNNVDLEKEIADIQVRLQQLNSTVTENNRQINASTAEITTKDAGISDMERQFEVAAQQVKDEFDQQRRVILSTLK